MVATGIVSAQASVCVRCENEEKRGGGANGAERCAKQAEQGGGGKRVLGGIPEILGAVDCGQGFGLQYC